MQTVTPAEARESLLELLEQVSRGPVLIRDGESDVAVLSSPRSFDIERLEKIELFQRTREAASQELGRNLARDGITVEQFLQELLAEPRA